MGPAGRGAPAAGCCSPHLPGSPALQKGEPVPSGAGRRRGAEPGWGQHAAQLPEGAQARGVGGRGQGRVHPEGVGARGRADPLPQLRDSCWLLARCHAVTAARIPWVYIGITPSLPRRSSPSRPDRTSVVSAGGSVPLPRVPALLSLLPSPSLSGCSLLPGFSRCCLAPTFSTAVQPGDTQPAGPLRPTAPLKSDPQVWYGNQHQKLGCLGARRGHGPIWK